jgi:hypothetical protein
LNVFDIFSEIAASVIFASVTAVGGVIATWIAEKRRRSRKAANDEIERIAGALKTDSAEGDIFELKNDTPRFSVRKPDGGRVIHAQIRTSSAPPAKVGAETDAVEGLISGYHEQALGQAQAQFWFSVVAATAGFAWILYAAADIRPDNAATVLKTIPGMVMDAVAFLFFRQASETRQRATDLYDRLRKDKQSAASVKLVSSIEDERVRSAVKAQIALHMAGLDPSPINLTNFLSTAIDPQPHGGKEYPKAQP